MNFPTLEEAVAEINEIFHQYDQIADRLGPNTFPEIIEQKGQLAIRANHIVAWIEGTLETTVARGALEEFGDRGIESARTYLENKRRVSLGLSTVNMVLPTNIHLLISLMAAQQKSDEQDLEDIFKYENIKLIREAALLSLGNNPESQEELKTNAIARAILGIAVNDGLVDLDELISIYGETCQEFADLTADIGEFDENLKISLWRFTADSLLLRAAISQLNEEQRSDARDKIKRATLPLLKVTNSHIESTALKSFIRSEIKGFLKSLALPSELARSNAGVLLEQVEAALARKTHRLQLGKQARLMVLSVGLGSSVTSTSMALRLFSAASVLGVVTQDKLSQRQLLLEDLRASLIPGNRSMRSHLQLATDSIDEEQVSAGPISEDSRAYLDRCSKKVNAAGENVPELLTMNRPGERFIPMPGPWLDKTLSRES